MRVLVIIAVAIVMGATPMPPPEVPQAWEALATASAGVSAARREDTLPATRALLPVILPAEPQVRVPEAPVAAAGVTLAPTHLLALSRTPRASQGPPALLL